MLIEGITVLPREQAVSPAEEVLDVVPGDMTGAGHARIADSWDLIALLSQEGLKVTLSLHILLSQWILTCRCHLCSLMLGRKLPTN